MISSAIATIYIEFMTMNIVNTTGWAGCLGEII